MAGTITEIAELATQALTAITAAATLTDLASSLNHDLLDVGTLVTLRARLANADRHAAERIGAVERALRAAVLTWEAVQRDRARGYHEADAELQGVIDARENALFAVEYHMDRLAG